VLDKRTNVWNFSTLQESLGVHDSSTKEAHRTALRTGHKLLRLESHMNNKDLYGLTLFAVGALWHTPDEELQDLESRLDSEQTFKDVTALNRGWFSRAKKQYDGMMSHRLNVFRLC
jgi:hypothetical protein